MAKTISVTPTIRLARLIHHLAAFRRYLGVLSSNASTRVAARAASASASGRSKYPLKSFRGSGTSWYRRMAYAQIPNEPAAA